MMDNNISKRWKELSGEDNWSNLLDPLDIDLQKCLIYYGELAQATYDSFNKEKASKFAGDNRYSMANLFSRVGLNTTATPFKYKPTKYFYATSAIRLPACYLVRSCDPDGYCKESNWMGYTAVATDEAKELLGRRDIVIAWRGTVRTSEWLEDFNFPLTSASDLFGKDNPSQLHSGFLSIYTSYHANSKFNTTSARHQVLTELKRLVKEYEDEEISITVVGHSLGASLATINACDIVGNGLNKLLGQHGKHVPVTVFAYASPRFGNNEYQAYVKSLGPDGLRVLRVRNQFDIVPSIPPFIAFTEVGEELMINTLKSKYLKEDENLWHGHDLEIYLHGVAGTQGPDGEFVLQVKRDIALVNKDTDAVKEEYLVPDHWWGLKNKGLVQAADGSWSLQDHENE